MITIPPESKAPTLFPWPRRSLYSGRDSLLRQSPWCGEELDNDFPCTGSFHGLVVRALILHQHHLPIPLRTAAPVSVVSAALQEKEAVDPGRTVPGSGDPLCLLLPLCIRLVVSPSRTLGGASRQLVSIVSEGPVGSPSGHTASGSVCDTASSPSIVDTVCHHPSSVHMWEAFCRCVAYAAFPRRLHWLHGWVLTFPLPYELGPVIPENVPSWPCVSSPWLRSPCSPQCSFGAASPKCRSDGWLRRQGFDSSALLPRGEQVGTDLVA